MRAVLVTEPGAPESFQLATMESRQPQPDEVRISVRAAGVSFVDVLIAAGEYQVRPELPFVPGSEFAGTVEAVGTAVTGLAPGDRVAASAFGGAFAEAATIPASAAWPIPVTMGFPEAAVFLVSYATAYHALHDRARLRPDEKLLVLGAGGALGLAAVQLGRALGATVIASASTAGKRTLALDEGATVAIDSGSDDWRARLTSESGGAPDVIFDPVGGKSTERALRAIGWGGRHLVVGFAAGEIPRLATNLVLLKGAELVGVDIRQFMLREPDRARRNRDVLRDLYQDGVLEPRIARRYPLERFAEAMNQARSGRLAGRVVLEPQAIGTDGKGDRGWN